MQEVYTKVRQADLLLIGSPVFFASVSAQLKAVIDRFQAAWVAKYRLKRPWLAPGNGRRAALICVGGMTEERHYRQTRSVIRAWLATLNWELTRGLWLPGIDARGDAAKIDGIEATIQALAKVLTAPAPPDPTTPDGT
jgi:multimeric flavodoxin WrbA